MTAGKRPAFMRRKAVAYELGISRNTLATIIATDARFPRFFEISPGIEVIEREDFEQWLRMKKRIRAVIDEV